MSILSQRADFSHSLAAAADAGRGGIAADIWTPGHRPTEHAAIVPQPPAPLARKAISPAAEVPHRNVVSRYFVLFVLKHSVLWTLTPWEATDGQHFARRWITTYHLPNFGVFEIGTACWALQYQHFV